MSVSWQDPESEAWAVTGGMLRLKGCRKV